nr:hypothetical protein [Tanacetum cinerariifolium]
ALHRRARLPTGGDHQRRRRPSCAPDAGHAGHAHDPPPQGQLREPLGGHRRRHPALACGAFEHDRPQGTGLPGHPRGRPQNPAADWRRAVRREGLHGS